MTDNWYQISGEATAKKLKSSPTDGLTRKAARAALRKYGKNEIYPVSKITFYTVLRAMTMDYTSYLLIAAALIAAIFEESIGAWVLVVLVTLNLIVTVLAYAKSQRMLESMDRYTLPVVRIIRDGRLFTIDQKQLVPGDLICVSRGDIVPADARLISAHDLCTDEERLFGRGPLRVKTADVEFHETLPPEKQRNMLFAGTLVISGEASAIVVATGDASVISLTDRNRPIINHESMPMLAGLQRVSRIWSLVVIAAVFGMTLLDFLLPGHNNALFSSFMGSLSFAVSTMSEMYVAFGYVLLACSVQQTVQLFRDSDGSGAIIKNPLCMEKLRGMTALVIPKEGILTTRDSVADRVFAEERLWDITDRRGRRAMERPILYAILSTGMYGEAYLRSISEQPGGVSRSEEETSILNLARRMDIYNIRLDRAYPMLDHRRAEGESEFETTLVSHKEQYIAISRGECAHLLERCEYYYRNGRIMLLTPQVRNTIMIAYNKLVRQAYSVSAVASRAYGYNSLRFIGAAQHEMVFEGFVAFRVPYLRGVGQLVADAREVGIKVILTTERPSASEIYFAKQIGIIERPDQAVDGSALPQIKEGIRRTNASYYRLYSGLDTSQKLQLLTYLREQGEVVGVVGHRLEDLCLLRAADISFAQNIFVKQSKKRSSSAEIVQSRISDAAGEIGCEALKFEADMIVSDATAEGSGGFRAILDSIGIAKNTDMNLIRAIKYLLCSQTARFLLSLYAILFSKDGMGAVQILFSGLFVDFVSVFIIALQKPSPDVLRSSGDPALWLRAPLRMGLPQIITGALWAVTAIFASFFAGLFGFAETALSQGSVLFVTSTLISVLMLFSQQREDFIFRPGVRMTALHTLSLLGLLELFLLFFLFPTFGTMFGVAAFSPITLVIIGVLSLIALSLSECIKMLAQLYRASDSLDVDAETEARHSQITELFHLFRAQKAQEDAALEAAVGGAPARSAEEAGEAAEASKKKSAVRRKKKKKNAPATLSEMESYVNEQRAKDGLPPISAVFGETSDTQTSDTQTSDAQVSDTDAEASAAAPTRKRGIFAALFKKKGREEMPSASAEQRSEESPLSEDAPEQSGTSRPTASARRSRLRIEDESDTEPLYGPDLKADGTLAEALRSLRRSAGAQRPVLFAETEDSQFDSELLDTLDPDDLDVTDVDMRPDPDAFAEAMKHIVDGASTRDITIGTTAADVRSFLRAAETQGLDRETQAAADREFLGIGYLFSEAEYEAIVAEYNEDGTQSAVYNTETQIWDAVEVKTPPAPADRDAGAPTDFSEDDYDRTNPEN